MKLLLTVMSYLMVLLGSVHTVLTPVFYPRLTAGAVWFAGTGLALVFLGLLNYFSARIYVRWMLNICIVADIVGLAFGVLIVLAMPAIQSFTGLIVFLLTAGACALARMKAKS